MPTDIVMPRLSDSMEEGTVLTWLKQPGDEVAIGDEIVEIETDKANMSYEADVAGTLIEILAGEGETVAIGEPIARVGGADEVSEQPAEGQSVAAAGPVAEQEPPAPARVKASPLAKRIAGERGVDLTQVQGSGPGGRIVKADVEGAAPVAREAPAAGAGPETAKGQVTHEDLSKLQQVVARRMSESKATVPDFLLQAEVDMTAAVELRAELKRVLPEGASVPTYNDMVVRAAARALGEFPRANGAYRDGRFELYSRINVGVAVAASDALVVPTVFDADRKSLAEIAAETRSLAAKVRDGSITPPELAGGTFTVSNLGMFGVTYFTAIVNTPQAGILAVGEIAPKPAVLDGEICVRQLMGVTLNCDHRILYGADGAQFLARVKQLLESPVSLLA